MRRRPPRSTRTDTLFPYTTLFRSDSLKLAPNDPRAVIARLKLQADAPVRTDTRAKLSMTSLTGSPIIQLTGGDPDSPRLTETPGREVPIILRSEERRGGKEGVSTCKSRWSPIH